MHHSILPLFLCLKTQEVWDDVRVQLRRHLLDRLFPRSSTEHPGAGHVATPSIPERFSCLQQLLFLYPEAEVLAHYQVCKDCKDGGRSFDHLVMN